MAPDEVPDSIRYFLASCIDSVEQLNVLLLFLENPEKKWTVSMITRELRSTESSIAKRLEDLYACKVLDKDPADLGSHSFSSVAPELKPVIRDLAELNRRIPYRIIEIIYTQPNKALRAFADAFRFKKEDKG